MTMKDITLRADAAVFTLCDDAGVPINTVRAARLIEHEWVIDAYLKAFYGWRTPTKRYKTFMERYAALGTAHHDAFIGWCVYSGYGVDSNGDKAEGKLAQHDWRHVKSLSNLR